MRKVLLVDDEPLILVGLRGMADWNALGWEITGTARNGSEALALIREKKPELVLCDIRMPVMDGFELVKQCRQDDPALPLFVMLTSYEEFDYVRQSMKLGVMDYLIKLELTPQSLEGVLRRAEERLGREKKLRTPAAGGADDLAKYRERLFLQLYSGHFEDRAQFDLLCQEYGLRLDAPSYAVAVGALQNRSLAPERLATLSAAVTRMAADILPKFLPCTVTGTDLRHFSVLFSPEGPEEALAATLTKVGDILYGYFGAPVRWAVGQPVPDILQVRQSQRAAFSALSLTSEEEPVAFYLAQAPGYHAQRVAQVQEYICRNLDKRLSLNEVASAFNLSPGYLSQLFSQWGERGFVEFVTATRVNAAKDLMTNTDLKVYEISERVGFDSAFYFSKVFKKIEGVTPREYMQRLKGM